MDCEKKHLKDTSVPHEGKYVGQTSRTLYERSHEHVKALRRYDFSSFMFKHWAIKHSELDHPPEFVFSVVRKHKDPMGRMIHEAVQILDHATMNSRSEWKGYRLTRLTVEKGDKENKEGVEKIESENKIENQEMLKLKTRVIANARLSSNVSNQTFSCRDTKRKMNKGKDSSAAKRQRFSSVSQDTPNEKSKATATSTPIVEPSRAKANRNASASDDSVTGGLLNTRSSDLLLLNSAIDALETQHELEGSGDSVINSVPVYRQPESFDTCTSISSMGSEGSEDSLQKRIPAMPKRAGTEIVSPGKMVRLSSSVCSMEIARTVRSLQPCVELDNESSNSHMSVDNSDVALVLVEAPNMPTPPASGRDPLAQTPNPAAPNTPGSVLPCSAVPTPVADSPIAVEEDVTPRATAATTKETPLHLMFSLDTGDSNQAGNTPTILPCSL